MRCFELMEYGLPAERFLDCSEIVPGRARRRVRFRPNSPWKLNRHVGERLSWRGRNFVEAFAEVNHREILRAMLIELQQGQACVSRDVWGPGQAGEEYYHFVCRCGEDAYIQIGEENAPVNVGELWRVDDQLQPAVLRAGSGPSLHLVLVLGRERAVTCPKSFGPPQARMTTGSFGPHNSRS